MVHWRREWQTTPVFLLQEPHEQYEKAKRYDTGSWAPRLEGVPYATGEEQRAVTNSSRKNDVVGPKQKWHSFVGLSGGESKVWHCKKLYCIGTWNVRSMNKGKSLFWPRSDICHTCSKPIGQSQSCDPAMVLGRVGSRSKVYKCYCSCYELYPSILNIRWNRCFWWMCKLAELIQEVRDGKSKHRHLRNQWTKMDGNGQI